MPIIPTRTRPTYKDALREAKGRSGQNKNHEPKQPKSTLPPVTNRQKNKETMANSKTSKTGVKTRSQPTHTTTQKKRRTGENKQEDKAGTINMEIDDTSEEDADTVNEEKETTKSSKMEEEEISGNDDNESSNTGEDSDEEFVLNDENEVSDMRNEEGKKATKTTYLMTVKFTVAASDGILQEIRNKYMTLLSTLLDADDELELLSADPDKSHDIITSPNKIPQKMTKMGKYFHTTSRPPKEGEGDMWSTFRISTTEEIADLMQSTEYDLRDENIVLMRKRLQCFKTATPGYLQFIDNKIDPLDLYNQITDDIGKIGMWTIVVKKPWEGFQKKKTKKKTNGYNKEDFLAKAAHIECAMGEEEHLIKTIRRWIRSGMAGMRFGPYVKYIEALTTASHPQQVERTLRMNAHGKRFQNSIDMVEMSGLNNPSGPYDKDYSTIRKRILSQDSADDELIFLSISKKWGSSLWQGTYIKQRRIEAIDFASCPAAWITFEESDKIKATVFKSFDPHSVQEARESTWDDENLRIITPSERAANDDEKDVADIPWLLDIKDMNDDEDETAIKYANGVNFNFDEEVSVKTTRITEDLNENSATPSPVRKKNISILRSPSDACSINSAITMDTRMTTLESTLDKILNFMQTTTNNTKDSDQEDNTEANNLDINTVPPILPKGGVGE